MSYIIAVDFDGTLCENMYPEIGKPNDVLIDELKVRKDNGDKIILWTCRVGDQLEQAIAWCQEHELVFDAVNHNLPEIIKSFGCDPRKIFANEYIDDRNVVIRGNVLHICVMEPDVGIVIRNTVNVIIPLISVMLRILKK